MMKTKLILPKVINKREIYNFFIDNGMKFLIDEYKFNGKIKSFKPNLDDLYFLYQIIVLNKRISVLEYGCGWSSLVISLALEQNKKKYSTITQNLRKKNQYELHCIDNYKTYINLTKKRMKNFNRNRNFKFIYSECKMNVFENRYCTLFEKKIDMNPDLIYLDGPSHIGVKSNNFKFNTSINDFMPMSADILTYEFFLIPGTIIIIDGRAANVNFLKKMFKRKWLYKYNKIIDQHYFILSDDSFGMHNDKLISFWKSK